MATFYKLVCVFSLSITLSADLLILGDFPDSRQGMFAVANRILGQLYLYEKGACGGICGLTVDFDVFGLYYDPAHGKNWWNYYFEPIYAGSQEDPQITYLNRLKSLDACIVRRHMPQSEVNRLVAKYFHPLPWIEEQVNEFTKKHFEGYFVVGVHYRGTDKQKEAPRLSYQKMFEKISEYLPTDQPYKIFIATDELGFLQRMQELFPNDVIAIEAQRADGSVGVHFISDHPFETGKEAVMDALLLSRCNLLIRTSSNLSLWSTYFNPHLPVVLLNQRFAETLHPE